MELRCVVLRWFWFWFGLAWLDLALEADAANGWRRRVSKEEAVVDGSFGPATRREEVRLFDSLRAQQSGSKREREEKRYRQK